jgi:hypothetical protein
MSARAQGLRLCCAAVGIAVAVAAASPCFASGSLGALLGCRRIEASAARLACFDRESGALATQPSGPAHTQPSGPLVTRQSAPPPAPPAPAASQSELSPRETFGLAPQQIAERAEAAAHAPKPIDSLTGHVSSITKAVDGREVFTLDNHQVWVQLVADGDWLNAHAGDQVTISRGLFGSYRLTLSSHRGFKVTRAR